MGGFGGIVFKGIEEGAAKVAPSIGEGAIKAADHLFGMDSTLTGKSGEYIRGVIKKGFEPEYDRQLSIHTTAAQRAGNITPPHELRMNARNAARQTVFGKNDQVLAGAIKAVEQEHGPNKAQMVSDHLGIYFHEQAYPQGGGSTSSKLVSNLGRNPLTKDIKLTPSPYKAPSELERGAMKVTTAALAYKAGLAHLSTPLNMLMSNSLDSFGKAMWAGFGPSFEHNKALMQATDGIGHELSEEYTQAYQFRNSMISKYAPGSVGEFIHKNWMIPGLSAIRQRTMIAASYQGKIVAHEAAQELLTGNERNATADLSWLGIDANEVKRNGGQLTPEQIRMAMYQNTQKNVFLNQQGSRSKIGTAYPMGRMTMMFHNYAAMQGNFILQAMKKELVDKRDPVAALKILATLGVIAPNVGNFTYSLEQLARGKDWDDPFGHFKDRTKALYGANAISENLESFTHIAGFGVATSYVRAAAKEKLANAMLGALPNAAIELGQDVVKSGQEGTKGDTGRRQLGRDILHDVPSLGLGSLLADELIPTKAQERATQPKTVKQIKSAQTRARHKRRVE